MAHREEIRGITWDLWGKELTHVQTVQRIVDAGFPIKGGVALTMFCIVEGESGEFQRAWHANVKRNEDGSIDRIKEVGRTFMHVKSIDLGFMQFNVDVGEENARVEMSKDSASEFVDAMFNALGPDYADPLVSSVMAFELYKRRGFQPWYAYKPGTPEWRAKKRYGALAFSQWLVNSFVGRDPETGRVPRVVYE